MKIILNGEEAHIDDNVTLAELSERQGLGEVRYAIEVNEEIVPRNEHSTLTLKENDKVEIVTAIGGG